MADGFNDVQLAQLTALFVPITDRLTSIELKLTAVEGRLTAVENNSSVM